MNKNLVGLTAMIVCVLLASWAFGLFGGESVDPKVAELEQEAKKISEVPEDQQRDAGRAFFEKMRDANLNEDQRNEFRERMMPMMMKMMEARMDTFLAMTPEEQLAEMDKRIDEQEAWRKEREANSSERGGPGGARTPEQMEARMKGMLERTTPDQRAKFETVVTMMNQRREERGLEPVGPRGAFGRGRR